MVDTRNGAPPTGAPRHTESLETLAQRAASGDRDALEQVCKELRDPVFRLALRFFSEPADAEDSAQEILLQVITHLGMFEGRSKLTTWVYRIASRHLLRTKRRGAEPTVHSAAEIAEYLDASLAPMPYTAADEAEYRMLRDEVRASCTYGMLLTLSRSVRLAYILGDLLEMTDQEGAEALEISPAAFRQRLARARQTIRPIIAGRCGLVDEANSCRCDRQIQAALDNGLIPRSGPVLVRLERDRGAVDEARVARAADQLDVAERFAGLFRTEPQFKAPTRIMSELRLACPDLFG
jgi:RNA polymerase sigma factor (sigma-70 family)